MLQNLDDRIPIVKPDGAPTTYFMQLIQDRGIGQDTLETQIAELFARILTAGAGLTGGGNLEADRTFNVGAGTGITVNADDVAIDTVAEAERIRDVIGTALVAGTNITITVSDVGDTITIASSGGGGGGTAPSIVQQVSANQNTAAVTLPAAPTAGNLLVAFISHWNSNLTTGTGWVQVLQTNTPSAGIEGIGIWVKRVRAGDTAAQTPATGATTGVSMHVFEIANPGIVEFTLFDWATVGVTSSRAVTIPVITANTLIIGISATNSANTAPTSITGATAGTTHTGTSTNGSPRQVTPWSATVSATTTVTTTYAASPNQHIVGLALSPA